MTSRPQSCFVYITLPGAVQAVTCGRFELSADRRGVPLGRFVYGRSYLERADAIPLDPVELLLSERTFQTVELNGVFGALRDAGPDYWGRRIIERHAGKQPLSELDYLLHSPEDRAGALGFGLNAIPPAPRRSFNQTLQLEHLQAIADAVVSDAPLPRGTDSSQIEELMLVGTSMGGARPKVVVEDPEGLWLAKLNRGDDRWSMARVEHATLVLARACGLSTAESKILQIAGRDVLLVKRFDRRRVPEGYQRARMVSALTLLRAGESATARDRWSYLHLVEELRRVSSEPSLDARELFGRMCFNALVSNCDDHPRNHAVLAWGRDWRLSPAYDLTPSVPVSLDRRDLALTCGDEGRWANARNLASQAQRFLLEPEEAARLIAQMSERVRSSWYSTARSEGVSERDCASIAGAFAYPGFEG
ncbi:MAG: type II toxin-antitoxin system HipA family toxin [Deltaproteobacteria bacterium]|nr:type II toxin-antitoxin system HipA family toxin [Deltaproteobacteria bacterium]